MDPLKSYGSLKELANEGKGNEVWEKNKRNCKAKVKFKKTDARRHVKKIRTCGGPKLYVYQCPVCGYHHLTKIKPS